jgi:Tfp pilus assembly protein PilN
MSLGLPEFGSLRRTTRGRGIARVVGALGLAALAYSAVVAAIEWRSASSERRSLEQARDEVARVLGPFDQTLRTIQKSPDLLVALASAESSPSRVWDDLSTVLPEGVSIVTLKVDYTLEGSARLDFSVLARSPAAYDRFLSALSASPLFASLKPGSEIRPGLVRATLSAVHRPQGGAR